MQIRYNCPSDQCVALIEYEPIETLQKPIQCPRCNLSHDLKISPKIKEGTVDACAVCGCRELFIRKDFPQGVGLAVVIIAGALSIYFFRSNFMVSYAILAAAIAFDFVLYLLTGRVTTCYACRAEYRKVGQNPSHEAFDLATSEKY